MITPGSIVDPRGNDIGGSVARARISRDLAPAMLAGYEAMIRLGLAIKGPNVLYRGIWPTYFGAGFATAAVAARLLRLDRTANRACARLGAELGLARGRPASCRDHGALVSGRKRRAQRIDGGVRGAGGFYRRYRHVCARACSRTFTASSPTSARWPRRTTPRRWLRVSFKPWCAARQTMAATQALREILDGGVAAADISEITAYVLPPHLKMIDHGIKSGNRASFLTSLPYQLALAGLASRTDARSRSARGTSHCRRCGLHGARTVAGDETLLADYPNAWPARIVVTTARAGRSAACTMFRAIRRGRSPKPTVRKKFQALRHALPRRGRRRALMAIQLNGPAARATRFCRCWGPGSCYGGLVRNGGMARTARRRHRQ